MPVPGTPLGELYFPPEIGQGNQGNQLSRPLGDTRLIFYCFVLAFHRTPNRLSKYPNYTETMSPRGWKVIQAHLVNGGFWFRLLGSPMCGSPKVQAFLDVRPGPSPGLFGQGEHAKIVPSTLITLQTLCDSETNQCS
eukprot:1181961-Amphidinium_carterae.1